MIIAITMKCYDRDVLWLWRAGAKRVYVIGQLVFTVGMAIMAATRHKVAVLLLSPTAGIMYATLFTMPYLLVAHYHTSGLVSWALFPLLCSYVYTTTRQDQWGQKVTHFSAYI